MEKGKGAIPREWDSRNMIYEQVAGAAQFDWDAGFDLSDQTALKVEDQDGSLSCVGQAWSKYAEVLNFKETGKMLDLSARFIYSRIFEPEGGAYIYKGAKVLQEVGIASDLKNPSYEAGNPPSEAFMRVRDDSEEVLQEAGIYKVKSHAYVMNQSIDGFALAAQQQKGLVTGFIGSNEGASQPGGFLRPPKMDETTWGHAVYVVGAKMINGTKFLKFINSWGTTWGDTGYGYISEDFFKGWIFNGITLIDLPNNPNQFKHYFGVNIQLGQTSQEVQALQKALKIEGLFPKEMPETGYYGMITAKAVLAFWNKYGVASLWEKVRLQGRLVGPKTRNKLNELYNS